MTSFKMHQEHFKLTANTEMTSSLINEGCRFSQILVLKILRYMYIYVVLIWKATSLFLNFMEIIRGVITFLRPVSLLDKCWRHFVWGRPRSSCVICDVLILMMSFLVFLHSNCILMQVYRYLEYRTLSLIVWK